MCNILKFNNDLECLVSAHSIFTNCLFYNVVHLQWSFVSWKVIHTARAQLMTYTRQSLVSHPWNNPIFIYPSHLSSLSIFSSIRLLKLPIDSALAMCLPSLFQSFTTLLVNQYLPRSVLNLSFSNLYPFPRVLS